METDLETETKAESTLTLDAIKEWTGARSFELGKRAFHTGALSSTHTEGGTLRARCQGSTTLPYRVEVILAPTSIESAHCTCGKGAEGRCKHTAALLIGWLEKPERFTEIEPLDASLERLSPQSLLTLLQRVVRRSDGIADLVEQELPFVTGALASAEQVNVEALRHEVSTALGAQRRPHYDDWTEASAPRDEEGAASTQRLRPIFELGVDYLARSRYALAATVYRAIAESTLEVAGGDVGAAYPETIQSALRSCSEGLARCLDGASAAGLRRTIFHTLVELASADVTAIPTNTSSLVAELLLTHTSTEERHEVASLLRAQAATAVSASDKIPTWRSDLLARLEAPLGAASRGREA